MAKAVTLRGKSSGQSMPGLVVETLVPGYLKVMLARLPDGIVIVTGTNGKTTTTKMIVELLRTNGKKVLTNATGSNLTRGIISTVSREASRSGRLPHDIAVFELDEAYAGQFTDVIRPRYVVGLNASRDQLDRFGEVDTVARMIGDTMLSATRMIITNADDKRLSLIANTATVPVRFFGVAPKLLQYFPRDDELVAVGPAAKSATRPDMDVELLDFKDTAATYKVGADKVTASLNVTGQHNFQNAAGALALVHAVLPDVPAAMLAEQLAMVRPAFGRGQTFRLRGGTGLQLNLVKNPASFRQGLASYVRLDTKVMIAINDGLADSRDMSWLWDVDFSSLSSADVAWTTGVRAADMALRLQYDNITVGQVEPDIEAALRQFCTLPGEKVVFASYTAMLRLHRLLEREAGKSL
ncbi:MAG TPA: MurT ligase domain-containing protein [Candidatus Saccharimonadales bacterium]|nr:MurT ligase domain-containing protein [Candidatus Saccharimonadales bacterium]